MEGKYIYIYKNVWHYSIVGLYIFFFPFAAVGRNPEQSHNPPVLTSRGEDKRKYEKIKKKMKIKTKPFPVTALKATKNRQRL